MPSLHHQKLTDLYESCRIDSSHRARSSFSVPSSCLHYLLQVPSTTLSLNGTPPLCIMTSSFFTLYFLSHYLLYPFLSSHKLTILRWQFLRSSSFLPLPPKSPLCSSNASNNDNVGPNFPRPLSAALTAVFHRCGVFVFSGHGNLVSGGRYC